MIKYCRIIQTIILIFIFQQSDSYAQFVSSNLLKSDFYPKFVFDLNVKKKDDILFAAYIQSRLASQIDSAAQSAGLEPSYLPNLYLNLTGRILQTDIKIIGKSVLIHIYTKSTISTPGKNTSETIIFSYAQMFPVTQYSEISQNTLNMLNTYLQYYKDANEQKQ